MPEVKTSLDLLNYDPHTGILSVEGVPVTYHCNVFNHFFAEGIKLALGIERGRELIYRSSEFAHYRLFSTLKHRYNMSPEEMVTFGERYFKSRGLGVLNIKNKDNITLIASTHANTYIRILRSFSDIPVCDVERGFVAALLEVALDTPPGSLEIEERGCLAAHDPVCRMGVKVLHKPVELPGVDCERAPLYRVPGAEERMKLMEKIMKRIPAPDETGIISLDSAFSDIRKVWITQLPSEYYAYAKTRLQDMADENVVKYTLTLAGFNCVFMTYVSVAKTPIGDIVFKGATNLDERARRFLSIGNYLGFGIFEVPYLRYNGSTCECTVNLYNFYENNFLRALGREPLSYFLPSAVLAMVSAVYIYRFHESQRHGILMDAFRMFDDLYDRSEFSLSFDIRKNMQTVEMKVPIG
ncbi:MAG: hypothetical protein GXO39_09695 [Thermotogae bacterium]|nr:hypothetical protein [Thermotogota bacterium]